jgi:hypothetical protein
MASADSAISELTWGRPPGLPVVSLQATMVENLRALRAAFITAVIGIPIASVLCRQFHLEVPIRGLTLIVGGWILLPCILMLPGWAWLRFKPSTTEPGQDEYRATEEGLNLPQHQIHNDGFVSWSDIRWWELRNHKRLPGYRMIVFREASRLRRIWLPGTGLDEQILSAFRSKAPQRASRKLVG